MVTARIDLQGLSDELNMFRSQFEAWAHQSVGSAEAEKEKHLRHLRELQTAIRNLQQLQQELEKKALEVQQRLHDEKEQVADLEAELSKIQAEQSALPSLLAEVQAALEAETSSAEADASDFAAREASQQKVVSSVGAALRMYEERLGLSFVHQPATGLLQVIFTQLDPQQPQQEFKLAVKVLDDDRYEVRSCEPPLTSIQELVDDLNASNDFSGFVRAARAAFKSTLA